MVTVKSERYYTYLRLFYEYMEGAIHKPKPYMAEDDDNSREEMKATYPPIHHHPCAQLPNRSLRPLRHVPSLTHLHLLHHRIRNTIDTALPEPPRRRRRPQTSLSLSLPILTSAIHLIQSEPQARSVP